MAEYVVQILEDSPGSNKGKLEKSYLVTEEFPIRPDPPPPPDRIQVVLTDENYFNAIRAEYESYGVSAIFTYHPGEPIETDKITWTP